jgi:hypothetical protein
VSDVDVAVLLAWERYPTTRDRFDERVRLGADARRQAPPHACRSCRSDEAKTELTAAAGLFRSMGMTVWLERAEKALA